MTWTPAFLLHKIPIGRWVKGMIGFLTDNFDDQFGLFSDGLETMIQQTVVVFETIPPLVMIFAH
jgi:ABC-type proline/glycine betaine transport system permease subunit